MFVDNLHPHYLKSQEKFISQRSNDKKKTRSHITLHDKHAAVIASFGKTTCATRSLEKHRWQIVIPNNKPFFVRLNVAFRNYTPFIHTNAGFYANTDLLLFWENWNKVNCTTSGRRLRNDNIAMITRVHFVLIIHEYTAPLTGPNGSKSTCDSSCICQFNITHVLPRVPLECNNKNEKRVHGEVVKVECGKCDFCKMMQNIDITAAFESLTHIYCVGFGVMQHGYVIPDFCSPVFKGLLSSSCNNTNVADIEQSLFTKYKTVMQDKIIENTIQLFQCGPTREVKNNKLQPKDVKENTMYKHTSLAKEVHEKKNSLPGLLLCHLHWKNVKM